MSKIILVTHQKGGVGKSTLTFNLAVNIKDVSKVCIVDLDYQGSLNNISELSEVPIFTEEKLNEVLKSDYDFIFIDTPPYLSEKLPELCNLADVIVVPSKVGFLDVLAIASTIKIIEQSNNKDKTIVVLNMVKPSTTLTDDILKELYSYDIKIAQTMISDLVAFTRSILINGVKETANAQKQIDSLTKEILTLMTK